MADEGQSDRGHSFGDDVSIVQCSYAEEDIWTCIVLSSGYEQSPLTTSHPK